MTVSDLPAQSHVVEPEYLQTLMRATGRASLEQSIAWVAEGRKVQPNSHSSVVAALVAACDANVKGAKEALRAATKLAFQSDLDTSAFLARADEIVSPADCDRVLDALVEHSPHGSLRHISVAGLLTVVGEHPRAIEVVAQMAGLSWRDLKDRSRLRGWALPAEADGNWSTAQLRNVLTLVKEIVAAAPTTDSAIVASQPIEILTAGAVPGWDVVELAHGRGVTYGTLLAQRINGGSWGAHRNKTAGAFREMIVDQLMKALDDQQVNYWASIGESSRKVPRAFLEKQVTKGSASMGALSLVVLGKNTIPTLAIFVAVAHDGGTARKTASTLAALPSRLAVPGAVVLAGQGWALRGESDILIRAFEGRAFGDRHLDELVALAVEI